MQLDAGLGRPSEGEHAQALVPSIAAAGAAHGAAGEAALALQRCLLTIVSHGKLGTLPRKLAHQLRRILTVSVPAHMVDATDEAVLEASAETLVRCIPLLEAAVEAQAAPQRDTPADLAAETAQLACSLPAAEPAWSRAQARAAAAKVLAAAHVASIVGTLAVAAEVLAAALNCLEQQAIFKNAAPKLRLLSCSAAASRWHMAEVRTIINQLQLVNTSAWKLAAGNTEAA